MDVKIDNPWEYIESFQGVQFYRLYKSPASTIVIFRRRLSSLAQSLVLTLLPLSEPLAQADIESLIQASNTTLYTQAVQSLKQYHILQTVKHKSLDAYTLTPEFAQSFKRVLTGSRKAKIFEFLQPENLINPPSRSDLDQYATQQWNSILSFLVGTAHPTSDEQVMTPSTDIIYLLLQGRLMSGPQTIRSASQLSITQAGFAFVLEQLDTQLWVLLFLCVSKLAGEGDDVVEALSFIFLISVLEPGLCYSAASLSSTQHRILDTLLSLGIMYRPEQTGNEKAAYLLPTHLVTILSTTSKQTPSRDTPMPTLDLGLDETDTGSVIVETNFRVYAYTSLPLQIGLLSLFIDLRSRHPNLVTGKITRHSIQRAVRRGISADQIISYLNAHAHPLMYAARKRSVPEGRDARKMLLPTTVVDQIHLWQLERDRMTAAPGFLLQEFETIDKYKTCCKRADERGILVWRQDKKKMLFVNLSSSEKLRAFMEP